MSSSVLYISADQVYIANTCTVKCRTVLGCTVYIWIIDDYKDHFYYVYADGCLDGQKS